ncbi:MAG TPA: aromatic ring-hydroxylating dioxygenase subunit alpha [Polyangiaceae bacterium]|nr:aromatic ring-hydroxylating dioxygenase subunit alpha [Polyangiaceae bacterium]
MLTETETGTPSAASGRRESRVAEVRRSGPSGNFWYAVEYSNKLARGQVLEVVWWKSSIALFRDQAGAVSALENRCAHRQLPLSCGRVEGKRLVCQYHGWKYDGGGRCVEISHELGKGREKMPKIGIRAYPVKERYGLVWIFPGDPALADSVPLPEVPELCGSDPWPVVPLDVTINAHFSMIVENVCDFNHAYLHRHKQPFVDPKLVGYERVGDRIDVTYKTSFEKSLIAKLASENGGKGLDRIKLWYQYPYQGSDILGKYLHWLFMLPIDERTTRCFFVFLFGPMEVPLVRWTIPRLLKPIALRLANLLYVSPLLAEDKFILEAEQTGFERHADRPMIELNPVVIEFQKLTLEKAREYQHSELSRSLRRRQAESEQAARASADAEGRLLDELPSTDSSAAQ